MKTKLHSHRKFVVAVSIFGIATLASPMLHAQITRTWRGDGNQGFPTAIWGGLANWVGNTPADGANNTALFGVTFNNGYSVINNVSRNLGYITYDDPDTANVQDFIIRLNMPADNTLNLTVTTGQPAITVANAGHTLIYEPRFLGTQGFAKNGPGRLVLSNPNSTYTGPLNVNGGILEFGGGVFTVTKGTDARTTVPNTSDFNVGTAGRVGNGNYAGAITIAAGAEFFYNSTSDTILTGNISGDGILKKGRSGILTLSGANTYTGGTTVTGGALLAPAPGSLPGYDASGKVVFDGGTIGVRMGGSGWTEAQVDSLLAHATKNAGALGIDTTNGDLDQWEAFTTTTLGATLGLAKLGGNQLTLNLANDYTGPTIVRQGVLALEAPGTLGSGTNDLLLQGGGLDLGGQSVSVGDLVLSAAAASGHTLGNGSITAASYAVSNTSGNAVLSANLLANGAIGLTKTGAGIATLAGTNTYTGDTQVSAGLLLGGSGGSSASDVAVATGAAFGPLVTASDGQWTSTGDLTYADNSILLIDFGSATPSKTVAPIQVANLTLGSNLTAAIPADALSGLEVGGKYPILTWTGTGPADASAIGNFIAYRTGGAFSVENDALFLTITSFAPGPIGWNTGAGTWDTVTQNWRDINAAATTYFDGLDDVVFGDVASEDEDTPITVTLNSTLSPASATANSTKHNYTVTGTGSITGPSSLTVNLPASRTFTLGMANSFTGGTTIQGGTLVMTNNLSLGGTNSVIMVAAGATLNLNGAKTGNDDYHAFIIGDGVNDAGAVIGANTDRTAGLGRLTLLGDASIGGSTRWDVRPITAGNGLINLAGFTMKKVGGNKIAIVDSVMSANGTIDIHAGTLGFTRCVVSGDGPIHVNEGAILQFENYSSGSFNKAIHVNNGLIDAMGNAAVTTPSPITLSGNATIQNTVAFTLNGVISGDGTLTKTQTGVLTLNAENTYSGATTISAGQITLGPAGSINHSASVKINAGATLNTVAKATYEIPGGKPITFVLNPAGAGSSGLINAAGLDITAATVAFDALDVLDDPAYVLANYTSLTGAKFASAAPPAGYRIDYAYEGNKIALVESGDDYDAWAAKFAPANLSDPEADFDGDGMTNDQERLFGLDPTNPVSVNPIVVPLNPTAGTFSFTRRDAALTGYANAVWYSTDLATWHKDENATLTPASPVNEIETVAVQLNPALLDEPKLFIRMEAFQPEPLLFADFEQNDGGFTVFTAGGTAWQYGAPDSSSQGGGEVKAGNGGSARCWGTNLVGGYGVGTDTSLRSPVIDLTGVTGATLSFARAIDAAGGHTLEVNVIAVDNGTVIANVIPPTGDADINSSPWQMVGPVALPPAAFGQAVRLEWRFIGNGDGSFNGVYIDDVVLTETP